VTQLKIFIEGEHPVITDATSEENADKFTGHRFTLELHGEKKTAVILGTTVNPPSSRIIPAGSFANSYPVLNSEALLHAEAVADYYLSPLTEVLSLILPPAPKRKVNALPESASAPASKPGEINEKQKEILTTIAATPADVFPEHLIWGVTGSGKTRVYEHLIAAALARGEQTLLLVPEIALSGQVMDVITSRFPGATVLYHSGLSDGERVENYRRFIEGTAQIAIGTRSAVFLPANNLTQIIIDEEHDSSFKDQRKLRFDTRTVARLRLKGATKLILGSATPSLESLGRAKTGAAKLHRLRIRATGQSMPDVFVPEYKIQHGIISPFLADKMREHLAAKNQVLLLMNRRGHSTHVHCPTCDAFAECPRCTVALTYHKDGMLRCHYCGYRENFSQACPKDGSERRLSGRGIQRVEEILEAQFPEYEYARLDRDTASRKGFTAEVLGAMRSGKIQILIGTQMIAKGFDIEGVTLVGVLAIDQTLNAPDFRAGESAWQLLAQVTGRSGRHRPGEVVIQTMAPHHAAIRAASEHDADSFYAAEADFRRLTKYPPFGALARIVLIGENEDMVFAAADRLAIEIRPENTTDMFAPDGAGITLLGPAIPSLAKMENEYRVHFLIKAVTDDDLRQYLKLIRPRLSKFEGTANRIRAILDIDPRDVS
jgi:primosomal protein N' (replication factor Y) (superfamily II helicase)